MDCWSQFQGTTAFTHFLMAKEPMVSGADLPPVPPVDPPRASWSRRWKSCIFGTSSEAAFVSSSLGRRRWAPRLDTLGGMVNGDVLEMFLLMKLVGFYENPAISIYIFHIDMKIHTVDFYIWIYDSIYGYMISYPL